MTVSQVTQLMLDYETDEEVNTQLEKMYAVLALGEYDADLQNRGYNIGIRLVDDFLSHTTFTKCQDFGDTMNIICKVAFG